MKIIFHGDDFGLTSGVNAGIIRACREGLLTSASIISCGEAAREAISQAKDTPGLDLGIHLTLCDEQPVLPPESLPSLIAPGTGRFPSRNLLLKGLLFKKIDCHEVEAEWRAQVETAIKAGIRISHLDSHQFVHLFPELLPLSLKLASAYDIPFVRARLCEPPSAENGVRRLMQWSALAFWSRTFASWSLPSRLKVVPSLGFLESGGKLKSHSLLKTLETLRSKGSFPTVEVILHPGMGDAHTLYKYRHWNYNWKRDLDLLTDKALKQALAVCGFETTSFGNER